MKNKVLHLALALPFVAFCATELLFLPISCVAVIFATPLALAALNHRRLLVGQRYYARTHPCAQAESLMRALGERLGLAVPARAFITDAFSTSYTGAVDALVVTPRWMETLKSDPDAATAVVVHELSHREEASRTTRYLVTLTFGTWPVLFVVGALYNVGSLHSDTSVAPAILRLAVTLATPSLAYGLGYLGRARASRALELRADTKVASVGYAPALIRCLADSPKSAKNAPEKPLHQLIESLTSSHPSPQRRIEAINRLGPLQASDVPGPLSTI